MSRLALAPPRPCCTPSPRARRRLAAVSRIDDRVPHAAQVREIFALAKSKRAAIIFFDEVDAMGSTRTDEEGGESVSERQMGGGLVGGRRASRCLPYQYHRCCWGGYAGDSEVQRTLLEIMNQLDGFDARGNVKVWRIAGRGGYTGCSSS